MTLNFNPTPIFYVIIGLLLGMVIGWLIGFFDSNNRSSRKIQVSEEKAEKAIAEANSKAMQAELSMASTLKPPQAAQDTPGLLRVKNEQGRFMIEMDGAIIVPPLTWDKRKRLIELVTVFRPYLETGQLSPASLQQPTTPLQQVQPGFDPVQPAAPQPVVKKTEPEKITSNLSIVGQIDTVLQKRLMTGPLANMGIRLQDSHRGGVEVFVGSKKYESIEDVPDASVKAEIRAAIAEWEQRFTPR